MHRWAQSQLFRSLAQLLKQKLAEASRQNSQDALRLQPLQPILAG
jgi:hypothetical protein